MGRFGRGWVSGEGSSHCDVPLARAPEPIRGVHGLSQTHLNASGWLLQDLRTQRHGGRLPELRKKDDEDPKRRK
ncbi:hypothetical protein J4Q44_G00341240 [Coregonus suidteri]|uniref:Uncharacterized protein n=1 Tax=Coregonus suidteri TaxID=861788 RepID=A0AAN8KPB5_9TELE